MNLHEYQAKQLLKRYSMPIPIGFVCTTPHEAEEAASKIGFGPWVIKCQVHAGGRGKSGGVKIVYNKQEVYSFAENWLGKRLVTYQTGIDGQLITNILVEEATNIDRELYLSAIVDSSIRRVVCMASIKGGVNIEKIAVKTPSLIHQITIDPLIGPQPYQGRDLAFKLGLNGKQINKFTKIFIGLSKMFLELDLSLVEINPLVITKQGDLICLDGKITVDDNALFRQPDLSSMHDLSQEDSREAQALQSKLNYIALEGNIGCMVNGAGLAMATMDIIKRYGGKPANFLDVGGNITKDRVTEAFSIILSDNAVKSILINIFGGIVRCDLIADGIINAIDSVGFNIPVVVRLEGNYSELGIKKLVSSSLNIFAATSIAEAAQLAVAAAGDE